ncbi:hypothetical protein HD806DRAFT_529658 [Xylariaceae sp. AK1471]|nr:hypothetical protein HD806DRAFT_529658 [Xylariaceae sp. AK1471]
MSFLESQDGTPDHSVVDNGTQLLPSTVAQQEEPDASQNYGMPGPLSNPLSLIAEIEQNAIRVKKKEKSLAKALAKPTPAVAIFIVPGHPDEVDGVIKQVYRDLKDGNKGANIELRGSGTSQYIRIEAPTEEDAQTLIRTAQQQAEIHLSDRSAESNTIFVEPPMSCTTTDFRVVVYVDAATKRARHRLEVMPGMGNSALQVSSEKDNHDVSGALCEALQKASSLYSSLALRIHLGHYQMERYKAGTHTLKEFETMVTDRRATGRLDTRLGNAPTVGTDGLSVEAIIGLIQAADSSLVPMDNQTPTAAEVTPTYVLEAWHNGDRYETQLEVTKKQQNPTEGRLGFKLLRANVIPQDVQSPRFEITSISVGRKLDWKITAIPGDEELRAPLAVQECLETAEAEMQGSRGDFRCYPVVRLTRKHALAEKLKSVAMKSVYRFSWKATGYVVQFTINRRWESVAEMAQEPPHDTDFDLSIYDENWDQDSRVQFGQTLANIWRNDLGGLLRNEAGDATGSALSRVQGLVKTVLNIRVFFEGASSV